MACEHGLAEGVKDTEFAIAVSYVAACNWRGIPIRVPEEFSEYFHLPLEILAIWKWNERAGERLVQLILNEENVDIKKTCKRAFKI